MTMQKLMETIDRLSESTVTLAQIQSQVAGLPTDQERANVLNYIAWGEQLPGLYDPVSGKYVPKQAKNSRLIIKSMGTLESDRILASKGLIPNGAQLYDGGMFGTDEYQQKGQASLRNQSNTQSATNTRASLIQNKINELNRLLAQLPSSTYESYKIEKALVESFGYEYTDNQINEDERLDEFWGALGSLVGMWAFTSGMIAPITSFQRDAEKIIRDNPKNFEEKLGQRAEAAVGELAINLSMNGIVSGAARVVGKLAGFFNALRPARELGVTPTVGNRAVDYVSSELTRIFQWLQNDKMGRSMKAGGGNIATSGDDAVAIKQNIGRVIIGMVGAGVIKGVTGETTSGPEFDRTIGRWFASNVVPAVNTLSRIKESLTAHAPWSDSNEEPPATADVAPSSSFNPKLQQLQQKLIEKGAKITADGKWGPETAAAFHQFGRGMRPEDLHENSIKQMMCQLALLESDEENPFYNEYAFTEDAPNQADVDAGTKEFMTQFPDLANELGIRPSTPAPATPPTAQAPPATAAEPAKPLPTPQTGSSAQPAPAITRKPPAATPQVSNNGTINQIVSTMRELSKMGHTTDVRAALDAAENRLRSTPGINVPRLLQIVYAP